MGKMIDLTGQKFNNWTVIKNSGERDSKNRVFWICKCECGEEKKIKSNHSQEYFINLCHLISNNNRKDSLN